MYIEKAFDSLDHSFSMSILKQFGFGEDFIGWIKLLLYKQESCVLNGGFSTKYLNLEKDAHQGDPISAYLFILVLDILFTLIKNNTSTKGIKVFDYVFLYTAYVMRCAIWYHLYNLKNVKNTNGVVLILVKLQARSLQLY